MNTALLSILLAGSPWSAQLDLAGANPNPLRHEAAGRIRYSEVYDGIHLEYYRSAGNLEYDFIVQAGADPNRIALRFDGPALIDANGDLVTLEQRHRAPVTYQLAAGQRRIVPSRFVRRGSHIGFDVGSYDRSLPLVIDPVVTSSRTIPAPVQGDTTPATSDAAGNVYHVYDATDNVTTNLLKLDPSGGLLFQRSLPPFDAASPKIAVDAGQNIYLAGSTGPACPANSTRIIGSVASPGRFLIFQKLSPDGLTSLYLTCIQLDGEFNDVNDIAVDSAGNAYIVGFTNATAYPASAIHGTITPGIARPFLTKVDPTGQSFPFSILLGGPAVPSAVVRDQAGNVFMIGTARNGLLTVNPVQPAFAGGLTDGFIMKVNPAGSQVLMLSYLGGANDDIFNAAAIDSNGNLVIAGKGTTTFPAISAAGSPCSATTFTNMFVTRMNLVTGALSGSTCLPGATVRSLALHPGGEVLVAGFAFQPDFVPVRPVQQPGARNDAFAAKADVDGRIVFATPLGGSADDFGLHIARTARGFALTGKTASADFPRSGAPIEGSFDPFVTVYEERADLGVGVLNSANLLITNAGPDVATNVQLSIGAQTSQVQSMDSRCTVRTPTLVLCRFGRLDPGAFQAPSFVTTAPLKLNIQSSVFDPNQANNRN